MECLRGFSFMSDSKVEMNDLQFIEGEALEKTWKTARRERKKQREQKIWDDFVKEKDVVSTVYDDDPYQFLDHLPESCLKELMEQELKKFQEQINQETDKQESAPPVQDPQNSGDNPNDESQHTCVVTFADGMDSEDMFQIYDDKEDENEEAAGEIGANKIDSTASLDTVREKKTDDPEIDNSNLAEYADSHVAEDNTENCVPAKSKSSEYVTNVIESSIYCAKVKDLRQSIVDEMVAMMNTLDRREILLTEPEEIPRIIKRSAEFCARFNRIYMYQITRQMHDVKRNNVLALPFAKHTQFQAQMVRIVSLHQNMLQSLQAFHKWCAQCRLAGSGAVGAGTLITALKEATELCASIPAPKDFASTKDMYNDEMLPTCKKLNEAIAEYAMLCEEYFNSVEKNHTQSPVKQVKTNNKKRTINPRKNTKGGNAMEARLSMYSLDTLRSNRSTTSKEPSSVHLKQSKNLPTTTKNVKVEPEEPTTKKKSPRRSMEELGMFRLQRTRRPLMRDPHAGKPRKSNRPPRDSEIQTLVENVQSCASSHVSPHSSPRPMSSSQRSKPSLGASPRPRKIVEEPKLQPIAQAKPVVSPRNSRSLRPPKSAQKSPNSKKLDSPKSVGPMFKAKNLDPITNPSRSEFPDENCWVEGMTPVSKIQCAMKKDLDLSQINTEENNDRDDNKAPPSPPGTCEVSRLLKQLCSGDNQVSDRVKAVGAKNAQLHTFRSSPRQPTTPQLLRILEETIQKKIPKHLLKASPCHAERFCMTFNIPERCTEAVFKYRTKFVQHMLASPMYANSAVGKPWELIGSVSEQIIDGILLECVKDMQMQGVVQELYKRETTA